MKKGKKLKHMQVTLPHWIILRLMIGGRRFPDSKQAKTDWMMAYLYLTRHYSYKDLEYLMGKLEPEYQNNGVTR